MRGLLALAALLVGLASASPGLAEVTPRNPAGSDSMLLAGKTCQGAFNTGKKQEGSKGALQLRFALRGSLLSAHLRRRLGQDAYDKAAYALTQPGQTIDATGFDDLGEVRGLTVIGKQVQYFDPQGARVQLTYDQGRLNGQSDPRGQSIPGMTRLAFVRMICR